MILRIYLTVRIKSRLKCNTEIHYSQYDKKTVTVDNDNLTKRGNRTLRLTRCHNYCTPGLLNSTVIVQAVRNIGVFLIITHRNFDSEPVSFLNPYLTSSTVTFTEPVTLNVSTPESTLPMMMIPGSGILW